MILAINSAQRTHELALVQSNKVLLEKSWPDAKDDIEKLTPTLKGMLDELGLDKKEITQILVISGPGSFTSLRTGVAFANALAVGLNAKLYSLDTFELLRRKAALASPLLVILNAGGLDVAIRHEHETHIGHLSTLLGKFPHKKFSVVSECNETQEEELHGICLEKKWKQIKGHELQTLGETILTFNFHGLQPAKFVEPIYIKAPIITKSSNKWKQ
ncbi:MAG: tRNA (adenosine(37)-N6)-threonylcarbamoyltransferase complex dimerization subunit type 1 TsaB [Parcubacteria group bacterium]|nr:tRNA (adenosine(37)-N6)-threonylcarbamoyltransferase complex dimerization subunit type 1 TsaB [Parcubacteria group bacterium]